MSFREVELSPVRVLDRAPFRLNKLLGELWDKRFPNDKVGFRAVEQAGLYPHEYSAYQYKSANFVLALEHLARQGFIESPAVLDESGYARRKTGLEECRGLFPKEGYPGAFFGAQVCSIGGPEAEIFAAMGAQAVSIDPLLNQTPPHNRGNLLEWSTDLRGIVADEFKDRFDLTISCRLFDRGSGLDLSHQIAYDRISNSEIATYNYYMNLILNMTKVGGISIHDGNMMPYIVEELVFSGNPRAEILEASGLLKDDKWGDPSVMVVLKKLR